MKDINHLEVVINKMFELAGHPVTYNDIVDRKEEWYKEYTMTKDQQDQWVKWMTAYIKKNKKLATHYAKTQAEMINLNYGLKIQE